MRKRTQESIEAYREKRKNWKPNLGKKHKAETKRKISEANKKKWEDPDYRQRMSETRKNRFEKGNKVSVGRVVSPETRAKLSKAHTGKKRDRKAVEKMARSRQKPVLQYDLNGKLITQYESVKQAIERSGVGGTNIKRCLKNKVESTKGFVFKYGEVHS